MGLPLARVGPPRARRRFAIRDRLPSSFPGACARYCGSAKLRHFRASTVRRLVVGLGARGYCTATRIPFLSSQLPSTTFATAQPGTASSATVQSSTCKPLCGSKKAAKSRSACALLPMFLAALGSIGRRLATPTPLAAAVRSMASVPRMARIGDLKKYKPTSPGRRHRVVIDKAGLWRGGPEPSLTWRVTGMIQAGRNAGGGIVTRGRKAPTHRRQYRMVDFHRKRTDPAVVTRLEYDPNRSAFIALIKYTCAPPPHAVRLRRQPRAAAARRACSPSLLYCPCTAPMPFTCIVTLPPRASLRATARRLPRAATRRPEPCKAASLTRNECTTLGHDDDKFTPTGPRPSSGHSGYDPRQLTPSRKTLPQLGHIDGPAPHRLHRHNWEADTAGSHQSCECGWGNLWTCRLG